MRFGSFIFLRISGEIFSAIAPGKLLPFPKRESTQMANLQIIIEKNKTALPILNKKYPENSTCILSDSAL